jgi:hypothetical protein
MKKSPGQTVEVDGKLFKEYYGSASDFNKGEYKHVEGKRILEPIKGKLADTLIEMEQDVQSSISYCGWQEADGHPQGQLRHAGRRQRGRAPADVLVESTRPTRRCWTPSAPASWRPASADAGRPGRAAGGVAPAGAAGAAAAQAGGAGARRPRPRPAGGAAGCRRPQCRSTRCAARSTPWPRGWRRRRRSPLPRR